MTILRIQIDCIKAMQSFGASMQSYIRVMFIVFWAVCEKIYLKCLLIIGH